MDTTEGTKTGESSQSGLDKENINIFSKRPVTNRRESLSKGILKNRLNEENNTVHVMQLPLRDSQQTENLLGKKSYRRRVSFAPEVTLHKIELIPQTQEPRLPQPRRRETIATFPSSSLDTIVSSQGSQASGDADDNDDAEEILYDSSDIDMEDDSHVYSSPGKKNGPGFQIHQDDNEEYTEAIDMSISRVLDEDDGNHTMDLTKPLGEIQQIHQPVLNEPSQNLVTTSQDSEDLTSSQRPFGSIKSLFDDDDEDEEMDISQPINSSQSFIPTQILSQDEENNSEVADVSTEDTMELTALADVTTDKITLQNTLHNRQIREIRGEAEEATMEQTSYFGNIKQIVSEDEDSLTQSLNEITMDETRLYTKDNYTMITTPVKSAIKSMTPLKANRSHTSETGSPISSKRKNMPNSELITNDLREKINSLTPRKRRRSSIRKEVATVVPFESAGTILSSQVGSQEELKSSFTPLRSSKHNRKSVVPSGNTELGSLIERAPLAPSHEQDEDEAEYEYHPVTLKKFLSDLSIEFFDDLNINEDFAVDISTMKDDANVESLDFTIARNSQIPWLELYSFSCEELQKNMMELKRLFDNLDLEFADENPQLVRDYYETNNLQQQKKMSDRLLLMKTYSDKEAEKSWYSWRDKLLAELLMRLDTNFHGLCADSDKLATSLEQLSEVESDLIRDAEALTQKLDNAIARKEAAESKDAEQSNLLKQQLLDVLETIAEEEGQLSHLQSELEELTSVVVNTTDIEEEIEAKTEHIKRNSQEPISILNKLLESFSKQQMVAGFQFEDLDSRALRLTLIESCIKIEVSLDDLTQRKVQLPASLSVLTKTYLQRYLDRNPHMELVELLRTLQKLYLFLATLDKDLFYVGLVYPLKLTIGDGVCVDILDFNKAEKYKANLKLQLSETLLLDAKSPSLIEARLIYGPESLDEFTLLSNLKSKISDNGLLQSIDQVILVRQ